jgi:hypothetical protein
MTTEDRITTAIELLPNAIAGDSMQSPLGPAILSAAEKIADSNDAIASSISDLAAALRELSHAMESESGE